MKSPQQTACLAKGYINSKFARYLVATDSQNLTESQNQKM